MEELIPAWTAHHNGGFIGGLYIRPFGPVAAGYVHEGHAHYIDHAMFVENGRVRVTWSTPDGRAGVLEIEAPNFITVKAEASHRIEALDDGTRWRCIFAEAEAQKLVDADGPVPFHLERADV